MSKLIAIDDGHGMATSGKRTPILPSGIKSETGNFMHENEFNRAVTKYLDVELKRNGFRTLMVAPTDADTSLEARVKLANTNKADAYISIHANALNGVWGTHGGAETLVGAGEAKVLGAVIHKHLMGGTKLRDRGVKDGTSLYVIRNTNMLAVLIEAAFMDNLEEAKLLLSDSFRKECAREIAQGLCEYYKVTYKAESNTTTTTSDNMYRVRKSWADSATQLGAFTDLDKAITLAKTKSGYNVYDKAAKLVWPLSVTYRVRKTWADAASQLGAFADLENAKEVADKNPGYSVFDESGKSVYTSQSSEMYRVRKTWADVASQLGAFTDLSSAKTLADKNAGYSVFNSAGKAVYVSQKK